MVSNTLKNTEIQQNESENLLKFEASGQEKIDIPNSKFISDSEIAREGQDLSLETSDGDKLVVENYFSVQNAPILHSPDGSILTENLVNSFLKNSDQFAQVGTLNDESPIGAIEEVEGAVKIIRADGSAENATLGTPVYEGDVIETGADGAANVLFLDETSLAVSDNARVSVDNYEFDAKTESGETNLSVLRGVFVYTSGLIGRDDPDDVTIETPVGSIGIRGTIIAGNIQPDGKSEITVVEGAIVISNGENAVTLSKQFETVKIAGFGKDIESVGVKEAVDMKASYGSVQNVIPKLFSSINDNVRSDDNKGESVNSGDKDTRDSKDDGKRDSDSKEGDKEESKSEGKNDGKGDADIDLSKEVSAEQKSDGQNADSDGRGDNSDRGRSDRGRRGRGRGRGRHSRHDRDDNDYRDPYYNRYNNNDENVDPYENINSAGFRLGAAVATSVADFNGDGVTDSVNSDSTVNSGDGTFTVLDGSNGLPLIQDFGSIGEGLGSKFILIGDTNNDGVLDFAVSGVNGTDGVVYEYEIGNNTPVNTVTGAVGAKIGASLSQLGDWDGDGLSDYAIGSPGHSTDDGLVTIQLGSGGTLNIAAPAVGEEFGTFIGNAGDVDAAGFTDILVGSSTAVYLYNSTSAGAVATASGTFTSANQILTANGIGDINGDGFDDFAISVSTGGSVKTHAIYGAAGDYGAVDLDALTAAQGFTITHGSVSSTNYTIKAVGDTDGDGYEDFQLGVAGGFQFVVHGKGNGNSVDTDTVDGSNDGTLTATPGFVNLVGNYDFDDGAQANVNMMGGNSQNEFAISSANFNGINGGLGQDTIDVNGNLDFTAINFEQIAQIEKIDLGATDGLTLTEENIFNLLKSSDTNTLHIDGATGATLTVNVDGAPSGATINDLAVDLGDGDGAATAGGYHHIQVGVYDLYIDTDIAVTTV